MSERKRIPVVVAGPPMRTGGTEQHLLHILPALAQRGFDISIVLLEKGGALEPRLRAEPVEVIVSSIRTPRPLRTYQQARLIAAAVRRSEASVVHAFLSEPFLAAALASGIGVRPRPKLIHARRSLAFYAAQHPVVSAIERGLHRYADVLLGNSEAVARELRQESGAPQKVGMIHNGLPIGALANPEERDAARLAFGLPKDAFVITVVANLHPYKGHADLIRGLGMIHRLLPRPWRILMPGRDAGARETIQAEVSRLGLGENVVMPGEWPGSRQPYAAADIGVLASHTEGFSNSLIEGMAMGLPMIATRVGGNIDAVEHGISGLLVPPSSPAALAEALLGLAIDPARARALGEAARSSAIGRYSLEKCVDRYEALWRALATGRSGQPDEWW
ncbi:MAG: glycosyltransferase [Beijerinckiaceae bacterium]